MTQDLSHVPRRLRRFYRHNVPVPPEMEREESPSAQAAPPGQPFSIFGKKPAPTVPLPEQGEEALHEPWMDASPARRESVPAPTPTQPALSRREQRKGARVVSDFRAPAPAGPASPPQGLFARVMSATAPKPKPMDTALGLEKKQLFEDRLPSSSEKVMQAAATPPASNAELQSTLNELKRLAATTNEKATHSSVALTSFHFTPAGGVPNPVEGKPVQGSALDPNALSPRQRVEMRRMRTGETGFGVAGSERESPSPAPKNPSPPLDSESAQPGHIRRRMGQVTRDPESERESVPAEEHEPEPSLREEEEDFKSLMGEGGKKKKTKKSDEEEDFSIEDDLDGDISPLDEDEK